MSSDNSKPLVGSCHKFSDGYGLFRVVYNVKHLQLPILHFIDYLAGYGQRYLTSRNQPTLPRSVPLQRHPPKSERFLRATTSTQQIGTDARAERRNADQIRMQTSGEIGSFYIDAESEAVKLGKTLLKPPPPRYSVDKGQETQTEFKSAPTTNRSMPSSRTDLASARSGRDSARYEHPNNNSSSGGLYMSTLQNLDQTFSKSDRRDLFAASMPGKSAQELVWCAANNSRGAQQSKGWAQRLRKESTTTTQGML